MASIFTRIIQGEIPAFKIAEDDKFLAFLDVFPLVEGHTLVIPKVEVDDIFDLDPQMLSELFAFAQKVGLVIRKTIPCKRIGIAVIGLEVPHAHIHLVPLHSVNDINFTQPKLKLSQEVLIATQAKIKAGF
jgi:histidine triad (HIT) family protein